MRPLAALFVLVATLVASCHARDPFRLTERRMQNLLRQASAQTQCPAVAMTSERISDRLFRVSGCGTFVDYGAFTRGRGRYTSARWVRVVPVTERVAVDLGCPASATTFTPAAPLEIVVSGCGRSGTYDLQCGDQDCGWVLHGLTGALPTSAAVVTVAAPPVDPTASLQAALQTAHAQVLACSGGQPMQAQLAWDGAGHMTLSLGAPFGGTAVESCVAGVLGSAQISGLTVPGSAAITIQ